MSPLAQQITAAFGRQRIAAPNEFALQDEVEKRLASLQVPYARERTLEHLSGGRKNRPDFEAGGAAIEVKLRAPFGPTIRQLNRYAGAEAVSEIILVSVRAHGFPAEIAGKPLSVIQLWRNLL